MRSRKAVRGNESLRTTRCGWLVGRTWDRGMEVDGRQFWEY
jgi:hypothetical protein